MFRSGESIKTIYNNQAEQFAILSALEYMGKTKTNDKRATIHTDSQTTLDKPQNNNIHSHIVEEIRCKLMGLKIREWKITLCWVKGHAGTKGNELADTLAKKAATNKTLPEIYNKIPKSVVIKELEDESMKKWQRKWKQTMKGKITKEYFRDVAERVKMKL
jgi:ribonuclease HI